MAEDMTTKIVRVREDPLLTAIGGVTRRYRVSYMLGAHGPYTTVMDAVGFTAEKAKAQIEAEAAPLRTLLSS
jgi:hypothetical protein